MGARYKRALSPNILKALLPKGMLRFLVSDLPSDDPYALDIQLREKDKLFYYHGTTSLLTIKLKDVGGNIKINATADKAYSKCPEYKELMRTWVQAEDDKLRKAFLAYLPSAIDAANPKCYRSGTEGYWQNRLCIDWGRRALPGEKFIIIDRECVIGFDSPQDIDKFYRPLREPYTKIRTQLQTNESKIFGKVGEKSFGDELDMLALDEQRNLIVVELKYRNNFSGICWGPLQVLAYRDAFKRKLAYIAKDIKRLVTQKVDLGLLPRAAKSRLPVGAFPSVKAVLAIAKPDLGNCCWDKLNRVISELKVFALFDDIDDLRLITLE